MGLDSNEMDSNPTKDPPNLQENAAVLSYIVSQPKTDEIDVFWLGLSETWGNDKWTNT